MCRQPKATATIYLKRAMKPIGKQSLQESGRMWFHSRSWQILPTLHIPGSRKRRQFSELQHSNYSVLTNNKSSEVSQAVMPILALLHKPPDGRRKHAIHTHQSGPTAGQKSKEFFLPSHTNRMMSLVPDGRSPCLVARHNAEESQTCESILKKALISNLSKHKTLWETSTTSSTQISSTCITFCLTPITHPPPYDFLLLGMKSWLLWIHLPTKVSLPSAGEPSSITLQLFSIHQNMWLMHICIAL